MNPQDIQRIGPYAVKRFVAEGGMAWVFLVVDPRFETHEVLRALKLLKPEAAAGEEFERFKGEAGLLAGIDHPNLVTIFDFGKDAATGCFFYTMTFVDGPSLSQRVREGGRLEEGEAIRLFGDLLGGLAELHRRGIVHRDIKPANVLIGGDGRARVADLGIARSSQGAGLTKTGFAVGTVLYMSPEQARGRQGQGPSADVFSAGLTLYEALTGRVVYDAVGDIDSTSSHDVLGYLVHLSRSGQEIEVDFTAGGEISKPVADVIRRACRFAPEDRFADAGEMRQALLAARAGSLAPAAAPRSRLWLGGAAGVALLAVAAVGWWLWQTHAKEQAVQRSARELVAEAERVAGLLPTLLERARDLPAPSPDPELLEEFDERMRAGRSELEEARKTLEQAKFEITAYQAPRARDNFAEACRRLTAGYLGARSDSDAASARQRADGLRQAGAPELLPDPWKALDQRLAGLEAPTSADCDLANAQLERIAVASAVHSDADVIEDRMKTVWPELAEKARDNAERQRELAKAEVVDAAEYAKRVADADGAFARGEAQTKRSEFLLARDAFDSAAKGYEDAAAIVPAAKLRAQVRGLEEEIARGPGFDPGTASLRVANADRQFGAGAYAEAERLYQEALVEMKKGMVDAGRKRVAEDARVRARVAREAALKGGAEQSDAMQTGDAALAAGEKQLAAGGFDQAEAHFKEAESAFADARKGSIEALADARELERSVRDSLASCKSVESDIAREHCASARRDLDAATAALAENRVSEALRALRGAQSNAQQAGSAEVAYRDTKQWEPRIDQRTPSQAELKRYKGDVVKLSVEASDQNANDQLRYSWRFDGRELPASGPRVEFRPEGDGIAEVLVDDGSGGRARAEWTIAIDNRKPTVTLSPSESTIRLEVGKEKLFDAKLADPDGDELTALWKLDGKQVGEGTSYRFVAERPGPHRLALIATDSGGAARVVERSIQVSSAKPVEPERPKETPQRAEKPPEPKPKSEEPVVIAKPSPPPTTIPSPAPPSGGGVLVPANLGISEQSRRELEGMLDRYRQAVQARDMDRFRDLWVKLDTFDEMVWKGRFDSPKDLDVRISLEKAIESGPETLDVKLTQALVWDGKPESASVYFAKLLRRGSGDWQITALRKGN